MPTKPKVRIEADTARYYLRLEHEFNNMCESLKVDADCQLGVDSNTRYMFRTDLHDAWERVVGKKPFHPRRTK